VLTALASLGTTAMAQENTTDYWMKKSREPARFEDGIRHPHYSINILIDNEKRMQTRAEEIQKNFPTGMGGEA
jgi:hypothetical protein